MEPSDANRTLELSPPDGDADLERGSIFFVGTATVIVRYAGFTILTDPNFLHSGDHVHLGYGVTSKRRTDPAIELAELPPDVDVVLLSHFHGDHFDRVVQEELDPTVPIVTTPHAADELADRGFRETYALNTWERLRVRKGDAELVVTSTPGRHGPPVVAKALPPVMGSVLEFRRADGPAGDGTPRDRAPSDPMDGAPSDRADSFLLRLYVTGDTVVHDDLAEIPARYPQIDLALLHLGGTKILGLLLTMDADQGVEAVKLFDADTSIPIHYDDYEVFKSPLADFQKAIRDEGLEDRVAYLDHGDTYEFEVPASRLSALDEGST